MGAFARNKLKMICNEKNTLPFTKLEKKREYLGSITIKIGVTKTPF